MKNNKKDVFSVLRARIPLWIVGVLLLVVIILAIAGFRITYAPELENSWNAISAVASWAGVIASSAAIIVAIQLPAKIASYQNKIALFDKRYEFYDIISRCVSFSEVISRIVKKEHLSAEEIHIFFVAAFKDSAINNSGDKALRYEKNSLIMNTINVIRKGPLLFDFDLNVEGELTALVASLMPLVYSQKDPSDAELSNYIEAAAKVEKSILHNVRATINLSK